MFNHLQSLLLLLALPSTVFSLGTWENLTSIASGARQEHCVASINDTVYIVGGITSSPPNATGFPPTLSLAEAFSTSSNTWTRVADLPVPMNHCNIASVHGKLYILGGMNGDTGVWERTGRAFEYCPQNDAWTELPSLPEGTERGASAVGVSGDKVYIAGGLTVLNFLTEEQDTIATGLVYDTRTKEWSELPDLPEGRDHVGGAVVGETFYVVGGRVHGQNNVRGTVFALNLTATEQVWVEKSEMPTPRGGLAAAATGGKIYTFGGEGDTALLGPAGVYNNSEVYDTVTDTWEVLAPMAVPRHGTGATAVAGKVYIPGGGVLKSAGPVDVNDAFVPY
ncbi:hypothetical protein V5O48_002846 [Marasmius crinis-equi]|uniref:Galactose oxidase n=1 Tax=Marasmius crinis-equi TaxID=585013 RepID=A0ABR3FUI4_9AGAR